MKSYRAPLLTEADEKRFWSKVALPNERGCMLWLGNCDSGGYGVMTVSRAGVRAHRLALRIAVGPPDPPDAEAAHAPREVCGNRHCVAPAHLRWATKAENQADRWADGTHNRGDRDGRAKLTWDDVREIREKAALGASNRVLGKEYGIDHSQICRIAAGRAWVIDPRQEAS